MNASYSFIDNVNDFFSTGYFTEDFQKKVFDKAGYSADGIRELCSRFSALRQQYNRYKQDVTSRYAREKDKEKYTHEFNTKILSCLGYYGTDSDQSAIVLNLPLGENGSMKDFHVRTVCSKTDGSPQLYIMDIPTLISANEEAEIGFAELDLDRMVTHIFSLPEHEHPQYILLLSGNKVFFMDAEKWSRGAYLMFDIERLLVETTQSSMKNYFALFYLLVSNMALAANGDTPLMQQLEEESYKNAYAVTQDLKKGVVSAVEELANEAIFYIKQHPEHKYYSQDETDDSFEAMMRDDCLVYIYRLLFIFYAESRPDLDILPINDKTYQRGYSLEMLRDLEQVNLITAESQNGYFFDSSIKQLFALILGGYNEDRRDDTSMSASFRVRHIDSPLFSDRKLKALTDVQFRNIVWQRIICQLSLSQQQRGKARGRISYANLGINQLGSVYENLLAYRGFYAEEDYIEVHPVGDEVETYLVPRSRRDDFNEDEILKETDGFTDVIHKKGQFIYRLNGRDRKKSASFYTPEVLTKSTVKYTLRPIVEKLEKGEISASDLLKMKVLEPAMGAAAFQNEVINQLAVMYLNFRKKEVGKAIDPLEYPNELQKVKAFIATNNVYGVDLNATAIELGKLSLWLNVIHKDMETPFFSNRLAQGNAVIGAWLKVYKQSDVQRDVRNGRAYDKQWWEKNDEGNPCAPTRRISFTKTGTDRHYTEVYHFLLPVKDMLGVLSTKQRERTSVEYKTFVEKRKSWIKGISADEYNQLKRISNKIDVLLKEYVEFQMTVEKYASNGYHVWQYAGNRELPFNTNRERQELDDRRYRRNSPYMKLKKVMDYWCSLFFWEYEDAEYLPTRQQYWDDIERALDVDINKEIKVRYSNADKTGQLDMYKPLQGTFAVERAEEESEVKAKELNEIINDKAKHQEGVLALGEGISEVDRFSIVQKLSDKYHFFHPMLEFLEVFWLRDGFDIICGNPPWLPIRFDEQSVISIKYPEDTIRSLSAPQTRENLRMYFEKTPSLKIFFEEEQREVECTTAFMNAPCNYPLNVGQQSNLYKTIVENGFALLSKTGFMGLLHPESLYDDANGQVFRKVIYEHLIYHFQYENELNLFKGTNDHGRMKFGENIYSGFEHKINFKSISNVFHPSTIDECFAHNGNGVCGGIKKDGKWNTTGHKNRIIHCTETELAIMCNAFEDSGTPNTTKLIAIHSTEIINVLNALSKFPKHVVDYKRIANLGLHEANAVDKGFMIHCNLIPDVNSHEFIYSGPHILNCNALAKNPRKKYKSGNDYDCIDLMEIPDEFVQRVLFTRSIPIEQFDGLQKGFSLGINSNGDEVFSNWMNGYKLAFREFVGASAERTLTSAIIPPNTQHIGSIVSILFEHSTEVVELCGLTSSICLDFFMKATGASHVKLNKINNFPLGIDVKYKSALFARTLLLNCLTTAYTDLWQEMWNEDYKKETWSISGDNRLKPFNTLKQQWSRDIPLRNYFERRMALVEIDVISAMALGLTLEDLEMIYTIQFPVLQQNEDDTWYDANGNIIFTCSKGLTGVGMSRQEWDTTKGDAIDSNTFAGPASGTVSYTIDPKKSELYGNQTVQYTAPFNRQNRIEDYRRAWRHFEQIFK